MELRTHWRAEPTRSGRVHRRSNGRAPAGRGRGRGGHGGGGDARAVSCPPTRPSAAGGASRSPRPPTWSSFEGFPEPSPGQDRGDPGREGDRASRRSGPSQAARSSSTTAAGPDCWESRRTPNLGPGDKIRHHDPRHRRPDTMYVRGVSIAPSAPACDSLVRSPAACASATDRRRSTRPGTSLELRVRTAGDDFREDIGASDVMRTGQLDATRSVSRAAGRRRRGRSRVGEPGRPRADGRGAGRAPRCGFRAARGSGRHQHVDPGDGGGTVSGSGLALGLHLQTLCLATKPLPAFNVELTPGRDLVGGRPAARETFSSTSDAQGDGSKADGIQEALARRADALGKGAQTKQPQA